MQKNIYEIVEELLCEKVFFWGGYLSEDNKLLKAKVYSDVMTMNKELLSLLLSNEKVKETFFEEVNGTLVFDKQRFAWFIESKEFLPDSYTRYTNKIGLTSNGEFISKVNDVVLDFPYKDCILEGVQDRDDQKRKEIFYNEIIAREEITKMLSPKVLTKAKRYSKAGVEEDIEFRGEDNLIIKGNNLIALSSILRRYEGKVKCIYIDPPYNTGNDSFNYNDTFNHSTWLTFMKNRLEFARRLLREDGVIFVHCDDNEQAYLKVLMDDVFGRENFESTIFWRRRHNQPNDKTKMIAKVAETIIVYAKNINTLKNTASFYTLPLNDKRKEDYKNRDNDSRGDWTTTPWKTSTNQGGSAYEIITPTGVVYNKTWMGNKETFIKLLNDNRIVFSNNGNGLPRKKVFWNERIQNGQPAHNFWEHTLFGSNQDGSSELDKLFGKGIFSNPKPELLINKIITIATTKNDLVLDFHLGSGTTCAVAHKMGRRYIGIEQMDYIEDITVERMKKVIEGEQGGISKTVNWEGGGSFVYCELLEDAKGVIEKIQESTEDTIKEIKEEIYRDERIIPYITREELEKVDKEFEELELEEKKQVLIKLVDKNKLYVNYSDIEDETFTISERDKIFTESFYEI
ncbi:DNA methyltransferase [Streptobacillus ratti]|uniref:DNA methyltransferase n=1 Tax=Streptobacillus ratti TaxID=1720557 RepID=UPI000934F53F|nr:site-specific DNA-methyltransferase [Streptobacillus ratti]